jgi:hypothetical protein
MLSTIDITEFTKAAGLQLGDQVGAEVKIRRANGEERIECVDTGRWVRFISTRGSARGFSPDLLIVEDARLLTDLQRDSLLPTMVARPNPQIVYS